MLSAKEFKLLPEWSKIEAEILKAIAQATDNTIGMAADGKQSCQTEAGKCIALAWVLSLPDDVLKDEDVKEIKLNGTSQGVSILARKGSQLF
jgi:hypothetical protein